MIKIVDNKDNRYNINKTSQSPALIQGTKFKKYQNKIFKSLEENVEKREGFTGLSENGLTSQTNKIISNNDFSNQQQTIDNLRTEYKNTLQEYENLAEKLSSNVSGYINRVNPNNPYLNKTVSFSTGQVCYVTNQGVVKLIPSTEIWQSLNIPQSVQVELKIPWKKSYSTPGIQLPTNHPLVIGTDVEEGQSFGNEGSNVFVNQLLPKGTTASYMGCYASSPNNDNMTFIGGSPASTDVSIQNGNFSEPVLVNNSYKCITSSSEVPGWYFNGACLINNSKSWGFPIPYPNGYQCVSIQNEQYINTLVNLSTGVNYTLTFYACGSNPINIQLYTNLNAYISTIYNLTPTVNSWTTYSTTFTVPTTQSYNLYFTGTNTSGNQSTAVQNVSLSGSGASSGTYTYNDCMQAAIQNGYQYFSLQNVNTESSTGYCAVSNSSPVISQYGNATTPSKMIVLWSSKTSGQSGNTSTLVANTGQLQVLNSSGTSVFSTPASSDVTTQLNPYIGCYKFNDPKNLPQIGNNWQYSQNDCIDEATNQGYNYVGLAGGPERTINGTTMIKRCLGFNDLESGQLNGVSTNCNYPLGGTDANALYSTDNLSQGGVCYLILHDNGNMVICRGSGPHDNQGVMWSSKTKGKQQDANPKVSASKGKYGQNWMPSSGTLAPGDFIGSTDGKIALVMQSDGNLVLYAYQMVSNCQKMSDGKTGGGLLANAAYDIGKVAIPGNMGQLAFIDANSEIHTYPTTNQTYSNTYTTINNSNASQGNIDGATYSGGTLQSCQSSCNTNSDCAGFVFTDNTCYPKNNTIYGNITSANGIDTYIRNVIPSSPPIGVTQNTSTIDTIKYGGYENGGDLNSEYGLANVNSVEKNQLDQLQTKLNLLSNQIKNLTGQFGKGSTTANLQGEKNNSGISEYLEDIKTTNQEITNVAGVTTGGLQNILEDSDLIVLQKNYEYLFWSILAAGVVLISMNIVKK